MTKTFRFRLTLTYQECMQYYQGHYSAVQVRADNGLTVQFPADKIRPFVTSQGITGVFELVIGMDNKFINLKKIA